MEWISEIVYNEIKLSRAVLHRNWLMKMFIRIYHFKVLVTVCCELLVQPLICSVWRWKQQFFWFPWLMQAAFFFLCSLYIHLYPDNESLNQHTVKLNGPSRPHELHTLGFSVIHSWISYQRRIFVSWLLYYWYAWSSQALQVRDYGPSICQQAHDFFTTPWMQVFQLCLVPWDFSITIS